MKMEIQISVSTDLLQQTHDDSQNNLLPPASKNKFWLRWCVQCTFFSKLNAGRIALQSVESACGSINLGKPQSLYLYLLLQQIFVNDSFGLLAGKCSSI